MPRLLFVLEVELSPRHANTSSSTLPSGSRVNACVQPSAARSCSEQKVRLPFLPTSCLAFSSDVDIEQREQDDAGGNDSHSDEGQCEAISHRRRSITSQQDHSQATGNVGDNCDCPHPVVCDQAEIGKTNQHAVVGASQPAPVGVSPCMARGKHRSHMG